MKIILTTKKRNVRIQRILLKLKKKILIYFYIACASSLSANTNNIYMKRTTICPNVFYDNSEKQWQELETSKSMHV